MADLYNAVVEIASGAAGEAPAPGVRAALLARIVAPSNHTVTAGDGMVSNAGAGRPHEDPDHLQYVDRVTMLLRASWC